MAERTPPSTATSSGAAAPPGDLIGDLFALVGLPNPLTGVAVTFEQMRRGSEDFLVAVETFTRTMENVNATAERLNRLLDDVEGPIRTVAPAMTRLADTLASPAMTGLPTDLNDVVSSLGELARRLAPLGQLAESAGGMFGLRGLLGGPSGTRSTPPTPSDDPPPERRPTATKATTAKKTTAKKATTKKAATKKAATKKAATKTTTAKTATPARRRS